MNLIADIGATNTRCALIDDLGRTVREASFENRGFDSLEALLRHFIGNTEVGQAALAVAAPITGDLVTMLNIDWQFSKAALMQALDTESLHVINDFEALAYALPQLATSDYRSIGHGTAVPGAPMAVLGPGSGLGVATAVPGCGDWIAVGGEGGHVTLPAQGDDEALLIADHGDPNGHCSAERLLSGPGLTRIHASLARQAGSSAPELAPERITAAAAAGDTLAVRTFDVFFALLGSVAGNLALTVGARGGVYIAGGIVPRVVDALEKSAFRERFIGKGRYREYLDAIPTAVITVANPAFIGLKVLLGKH